MKKILCIIFTCGFLSITQAQIVNVPDPNFKTYLLNHPGINTNSDNEIQVSEALNFTDSILCYSMQIYDLTGIEAFENIPFLSCVNNELEGLDVSHNTALQGLICAMNHISSLDVSANTNLRNLRCSLNPIGTLNIGNNPNLEYLYCENNSLTVLDVSQNPALIELYCTSNSIQNLNLTNQLLLKKLDCSSNMSLSQLDFAPNSALEYIMCNGNQLPAIDLENCPALVDFRGVGGSYTQLDLSNCPNLKRFDCPFTHLTSLDFSQNPLLEVVYCFSSQLTSLNIANGTNPNLQLIWVQDNELTCIQVDDAAYSTANWTGNSFAFDAGVSFDPNCVLGVSHLEKPLIAFYPNPATTGVNIQAAEKTSYKLISIAGTILATGEFSIGNNVLNIESLSPGAYMIDCLGATTGRFVQKLEKTE
jgi:hypothetical protein